MSWNDSRPQSASLRNIRHWHQMSSLLPMHLPQAREGLAPCSWVCFNPAWFQPRDLVPRCKPNQGLHQLWLGGLQADRHHLRHSLPEMCSNGRRWHPSKTSRPIAWIDLSQTWRQSAITREFRTEAQLDRPSMGHRALIPVTFKSLQATASKANLGFPLKIQPRDGNQGCAIHHPRAMTDLLALPVGQDAPLRVCHLANHLTTRWKRCLAIVMFWVMPIHLNRSKRRQQSALLRFGLKRDHESRTFLAQMRQVSAQVRCQAEAILWELQERRLEAGNLMRAERKAKASN